MTKRAAPVSAAPAKGAQTTKLEDTFLPPLKPVPKLFTALLIGFAIWLALLLTLYIRTVYPLRHAPSTAATRPGASALPSAPR